LHKHGNNAGGGKAPLPKDFYSEKLAQAQFVIYLVALTTLLTGILFAIPTVIRIGSILLLVTAMLYNLNIFKIIFINAKSSKLI
jgi:uncharacterized membrane protein YphA (DoxX/SURF4 family)